MKYRHHPELHAPISAIGLGCGRLGSMSTARSPTELRALVHGARDLGITVFDTSDIYGQGRSERLLGEVLGADKDICLITKAGQRFTSTQKVLSSFRRPISAILRRSKAGQSNIRAIRGARQLPRDYSPEHLGRALGKSLRRLRRDHVDIFLLHSPRTHHLEDGAALDALAEIKRKGLARLVGVSVDDREVLQAVHADARVDVIQAPFGYSRQGMTALLGTASKRGALVIAREILSSEDDQERPAVPDAVRFAAFHPAVGVALLGTTNVAHLREAVNAIEGEQP